MMGKGRETHDQELHLNLLALDDLGGFERGCWWLGAWCVARGGLSVGDPAVGESAIWSELPVNKGRVRRSGVGVSEG